MSNDNMKDITELEGPTAFYHANGAAQVKEVDTEGLYEHVYKDTITTIMRYLAGSNTPRYIVSAVLSVALDIATTAMAITDYAENEADGLTQPKDIEGFMATVLMMLNAMPQAIEANKQLLIMNKSMFTKDKLLKLDS